MGYVQPGYETRPVEVQQGRPFVTSPEVSANYQQPAAAPAKPEVQTAKPFAAIATASHSPYVQPHDHRPKEVHHDRLSVPNVTVPDYVQPGVPLFPTQYDAGIIFISCPLCGTRANHTGSSTFPFRCQNNHQTGPTSLGIFQGPTGAGGVISGQFEYGTGTQLANPGAPI